MTSKPNAVGEFGLTPKTVSDTRELLHAERATQRGSNHVLAPAACLSSSRDAAVCPGVMIPDAGCLVWGLEGSLLSSGSQEIRTSF